MEEKELLLKIENLEKRVSLLEKQLETISQINQSEKVKEYIASAEKASKIAKLLDTAIDKKINDSPIENATISDVLSNSSIMKEFDTAKEFVADIDSDVEKQIRENNDEVNKYDWDTLFDYEEVDGQITIKSYIGFDDMNVVVIPDKINGLFVTKIGEKAFENCKGVKEVILPKHLITIGSGAFWGSGITTISLPESLYCIEDHAFAFSNLEKVHIPSNMERIAESTFFYSKIKGISFSPGIKSIEKEAFRYCDNLINVDIPYSVKTIGENAFEMGSSMHDKYIFVRIPDSVENMYGLEGCRSNIFGDWANKLTIYCNAGSTAMKYARKYDIQVRRYEEFDLLEE